MNKNQSGRRTKQLISIALYQLMYTLDYDQISVKEICNKARISRMSFYRYFNCKDDIFINYCDERFEEFYNHAIKSDELNSHDFTLELFTFVKKYSKQIKVLIKAHKEQLLSAQFKNYAHYIVKKDKFLSAENPKSDYVLAAFLSGGFFSVVMAWIEHGLSETPEEMTAIFMSLFTNNDFA